MQAPNIIHRQSPNGFEGNNPDTIIVHCMGYQLDVDGTLKYAASFLEDLGLSAHVLACPDGTLIRTREDNQVAYHARGHNQDSLGIEVLHPTSVNIAELEQQSAEPWVSSAQFDSVVWQVRRWIGRHGILIDNIKRHSDTDPERKWFDPGDGFPWEEFLERL